MAKETTSASRQDLAGSISPALGTPNPVTEENRHRMICKAAYYLAERRGFEPGHQEEDWAKAEAEIDRILRNATSAEFA